ncbi:hypothetical protein IV203_025151 [Nitzschia inconspicua]|nr:hypothetical protein IV203_025151 [Nitzschia inconspicua]
MSTALGVRWDLPSPFISSSPNNASGDYQPTPPLSALHLVRSFSNDQEESIDISFLYPQYSNGTSWSNDDATGASRGILQSTNVIWRDGFQTDEVSMSTEATPFGTIARLLFSKEGSSARSKNDRGLLRNLEIHVETTLQHYPVSCLLLGFFFGCINARRPCLHRQRCNNMRGGTLVPPSDDNDEASQAHPKWDNKSTVSSSVTETLPNDLELL